MREAFDVRPAESRCIGIADVQLSSSSHTQRVRNFVLLNNNPGVCTTATQLLGAQESAAGADCATLEGFLVGILSFDGAGRIGTFRTIAPHSGLSLVYDFQLIAQVKEAQTNPGTRSESRKPLLTSI